MWLFGAEGELAIRPIEAQEVDELTPLVLTVEVDVAERLRRHLEYSLRTAPEGAQIDPQTGEFFWRPTEAQGPGSHKVVVRVADRRSPERHAEARFTVDVREVNAPPVLASIADRRVEAAESLAFTVKGKDPDQPAAKLRFDLLPGGPAGARVDARTGEFRWDTGTAEPGKEYEITIRVSEDTPGGLMADASFNVRIERTAGPVVRLAQALRLAGASVEPSSEPMSQPFAGQCSVLRVDGESVAAIEYETAAEAARAEASVSAEMLAEYGTSGDGRPVAKVFRSGRLVVFYGGGKAAVLDRLAGELGDPVLLAAADDRRTESPGGVDPVGPPSGEDAPAPDLVKDEDAPLLQLHDDGKLLLATEYPTLRKFFADRFQQRHQDEIRRAFGNNFAGMMQWFDEHPVVREEFFTAIDPEHDKVVEALKLFAELTQRSPDQAALYWNLAIATAVTWDDERRGVYDYVNHQRHTKSNLREGRLAAVGNFDYMITAEKFMQLRAQFLPWEFLVHVINHKTPADERAWARRNYAPRIVMFGKCYKDVPYDRVMLDTGSKKARLNGKDYSLPVLRTCGGVCFVQADFAARVGKSIGVPAAYVQGESAYGGGHAWVMWVELRNVTKNSITFTLESEGRYRGDKFYVGTLRDPQTGQTITDRELELRLHNVGMSPENKRRAALLMKSYPILLEKTEMDVAARLSFLAKVVEFCPGNEAAWTAVADMSREGVIAKEHGKQVTKAVNGLFVTFAKFPDFTWKIFDDLIAFQDNRKQRATLYERLVVLCEQAGRPDLACEARLKYTEHLVEDEQCKQAIAGLAFTIMKFPEEGRYVPKMLDKLEEICTQVPGMESQLTQFYRNFLPRVPRMRMDRPSPYCIKVYERAIEVFRRNGHMDLVQLYQVQLATLKAQKRG